MSNFWGALHFATALFFLRFVLFVKLADIGFAVFIRPERNHSGDENGKQLSVSQIQTEAQRTAVFGADPENVRADDKGHECSGQSRDPAGFLL